jgi:hypothetical protein
VTRSLGKASTLREDDAIRSAGKGHPHGDARGIEQGAKGDTNTIVIGRYPWLNAYLQLEPLSITEDPGIKAEPLGNTHGLFGDPV